MASVIRLDNLTKTYGKGDKALTAINKLSFDVQAGQIYGFLGPNGAGKTTTVRMMTSILPPTSGWAKIAGFDVTKEPELVRANVGVLTEQHGLYQRMKGVEYLSFFAEIYHIPKQDRAVGSSGLGACRQRTSRGRSP